MIALLFKDRLVKAISEAKRHDNESALKLHDEILAFERAGGSIHEVDDFYLDQLICILDSHHVK